MKDCARPVIYCYQCRVEFCGCCHDIMNYRCPICLENPDSYEYSCDDCKNIFYKKYTDKQSIYCLNCDNIICENCGYKYCAN